MKKVMALIGAVWLAGCAAPQTQTWTGVSGALPQRAFVAAPHFAGDRLDIGAGGDESGSAAVLALALGWSGQSASPALLTRVADGAQPAGTQADLVAAIRRHGRLAYSLRDMGGLLREVAAGRPVAVMLDVSSISIAPQLRYAVVTGYDLASGEIMLSGKDRHRQVMALRQFERSWAASNRWGLLVLKPGDLPAAADRGAYLHAAAGLALEGQPWEAVMAYDAALSLWPDSPEAFTGLGHSLAALGDRKGAAECFVQASKLTSAPGAALANADKMVEAAMHGVALAGEDSLARGNQPRGL